LGQTKGAVRTGIGDFRDAVVEAIGNSGLAPQINNATILGALKLGVRTTTPGADFQVFGGLSVTSSSAASANPGDGCILLDNSLKFAPSLGTKISFPAPTGSPLEIGRQTDSLYIRTKLGGSIVAYAGGVHSDNQFAPGVNGVELLRLTENTFQYKGQTVYHSGNGVFIRKDAADSATGLITFNAGLTVPSSNITIGSQTPSQSTGKIIWNTTLLGSKIHLHNVGEDYSFGIQNGTLYARTGGNFILYRGGSFVDAATPAPGVNGETLLQVGATTLQYKGQNIYHTGNSNFVPKVSAARPGVIQLYFNNEDTSGNVRVDFNSFGDGRARLIASGGSGQFMETRVDIASAAYNSAYDGRRLTVNESGNRPGVTRMYRADSDEGSYLQTYWDGSRYFIEGKGSNGAYLGVRVERADNCGYADTAGSVNYIHGQNIQDGTVRYWELSRGDATATNNSRFGVHQYAFGSPITSFSGTNVYLVMGNTGVSPGEQRSWSIINSNTLVSGYYVRWDYVTGSGDPYTWVVSDSTGEIIASYDAEDPFDRDNPELCPIFLDNGNPDPKASLIQYPAVEEIIALTEGQLDKYNLPPWLSKHKFKDKKTPKDLYWALLKDYAKGRFGMHQLAEHDMSMWEFVEELPGDVQKKNWRKQGALKVLSQLAYSTSQPKVHDFLKQHYRVNKKNGKLTLK
jgi:hypothetical protein